MSPKRLRWTGLVCLTLSALTAFAGLFTQVSLIIFYILIFHVTVQVPVGAVGGVVGPTTLPVPRVMPVALLVAGLFLAVALVCFFETRRRVVIWRRPAFPGIPTPESE
jgi:hypothetical protein